LLLTIGSTDFWEFFNKTLNSSELNMIAGFKFDEITLMNLSEKDASRIMKRYLTEFWNTMEKKSIPKGADSIYPFSLKTFQYLYEIHDRNLRDTLKTLYNTVEKYKVNNQINYLKDIKDSIFNLRPTTDPIYLFENEMNYLEDFLSSYTNRNQLSRNIEFGLLNAFNEIKDKSPFGNVIRKVLHEPNIQISGGKSAKPDVYFTLFGTESVQEIKKAEIQVKAYYPSNKVKKKEIEGSLSLLEEDEMHYLHFITLSPLDEEIINSLQSFGPKVGRVSKLTNEESYYLLLLIKEFSNLFFKKEILDVNSYIQILSKIGIRLPDFFEKIKKIEVIEKPSIKLPKPEEKEKELKRPKTPDEKITNPSKVEPYIISLLQEKKLVRSQQVIINEILKYATSQNVIKNAMSNLKERSVISYSRKTPQGWSLI
jgi:hypothetical protein